MNSSDKINKKAKVAVGLSGGVDSAVSAYLLKEQGYDITGVFLKCWEKEVGCDSDKDKIFAIRNAKHLGIKFEQLNFVEKYTSKVLDYFFEEYKAGRTPNPDVMCNKEIKFGLFYEWAMNNGFDFVATGHYARVVDGNLLKGIDDSKDQSYFLYLLDQEKLNRVLFPVGNLLKEKVRVIAKNASLPSADRPDSVGICFIGEIDVRKFLEDKLEKKEGNVLDISGAVVGRHDGVWFYTIGQRHGFEVDAYKGVPMYVIKKDAQSNELVVGPRDQALRDSFYVEDLHWITKGSPKQVRIRHLGDCYDCELVDNSLVKLNKPIFGVAPGQSAVFYNDEVLLGGGVIQ
ncbi:MAG TPA: tRNA 2-thiouridine(34) synthase MnmA [Patescibacteria group bacterium]|nr:tRNA 2-thiouridine(34) synthase MnmA [Patescibacteria group bacterium]